ncbi:MAG: Holliday junction branch migration protein RuvA [Deltaproteobacteria bacterium]|jgi:Holliday junction DNA helicase RuvA|nr:Holliday junction branch migration protein RuvA [Deltaproteobacteria bacterium]
MIGFVRGTLLEKTEHSCLVLCSGGVGYELSLTDSSLARLPGKGREVNFYVYTQVSENSLGLYGFETWDERETFQLLLGINRVGPRTAQAILGVFSPEGLRRLVLEDDVLGLSRVSGIGRKGAQQIFLELKYKLKLSALTGTGALGDKGDSSALFRDALAGLVNLGYAEEEAADALRESLGAEKGADMGELLRAALKRLSSRRR